MVSRVILIFMLLNVAACQTPVKQSLNPKDAFFSCGVNEDYFLPRNKQFAENNYRKLRAKVAVITSQVKEQGTMVWEVRQSTDDIQHEISIYGPFGAGATKLTFDTNGAQLTDNKGRGYQRISADQLLSEITDWPIPLEALVYWLMAVPQPNSDCEYQLNEQNQLSVLKQAGWQVNYSNYRQFDTQLLPARIVAETGLTISAEGKGAAQDSDRHAKVKLIVKSWQLNEMGELD